MSIKSLSSDFASPSGSWTTQVPKPDVNQRAFDDLVDTPTQNNTGDEYYWQHQSQLQQSALDFTRHQQQAVNTRPTINNTVCTHNNTPQYSNIPLELPTNLSVQEQVSDTSKTICVKASERHTSRSSSPSKQAITPTVIHHHEELTEQSLVQSVETPHRKYLAMMQQIAKNHHLFIKDQHAELSLQINTSTPHEIKAIKQWIKKQFKQQGLTLQLTINGVTHE